MDEIHMTPVDIMFLEGTSTIVYYPTYIPWNEWLSKVKYVSELGHEAPGPRYWTIETSGGMGQTTSMKIHLYPAPSGNSTVFFFSEYIPLIADTAVRYMSLPIFFESLLMMHCLNIASQVYREEMAPLYYREVKFQEELIQRGLRQTLGKHVSFGGGEEKMHRPRRPYIRDHGTVADPAIPYPP
jgi:hypothetical protein